MKTRLFSLLFLAATANFAIGQNGGSLTGGGGGGGGTPGGSTTQLQYNNAGAFAGTGGITTDGNNLSFAADGQGLFFPGAFKFYTIAGGAGFVLNAATADCIMFQPTQTRFPANSVLGWTSAVGGASSPLDTGLYRNAAGVLEVNNGTAGTFADLKARNVILSGAATGKGSVPVGGAVGSQLTKNSATDYDVGWSAAVTLEAFAKLEDRVKTLETEIKELRAQIK